MRNLLALLILFSAPAFAKPAKVILTVDLKTNSVSLVKTTQRGKTELRGEILPAVGPSLHSGVFRPMKMREDFRSPNGNAVLKDVILFDGNRIFRKSEMFQQLKTRGVRTSGAIVMDPEFGSLVFSTIKSHGLHNTVIIIRG